MRIMYVEDNPANLFLVQRIARMGNHDVVNYADGETALKNFETDRPDLMLVDVQLAGEMTGLEMVKKLREKGVKTPIVAVTAYAMVGDRERCLEAGCDGYLAKPLPVPDLVELIRRHEGPLPSVAVPTAQPAPAIAVSPPSPSVASTPPAAPAAPTPLPTPAPTTPAIAETQPAMPAVKPETPAPVEAASAPETPAQSKPEYNITAVPTPSAEPASATSTPPTSPAPSIPETKPSPAENNESKPAPAPAESKGLP